MPQDRVSYIDQQSSFYLVNFRRLLTVSFVLLGLAYLLLGFIIYQHFIRPVPKYFAATSDGRLIEIRSLSEIQKAVEPANTSNTNTPATP